MILERLRKCMESADWQALSELYAEGAMIDSNVPLWRFQISGRDTIAKQYRDWYGEKPIAITGWRERPAEWGAVVEIAEQADTDEGLMSSRAMHAFTIEDGLITSHVMYCTGPWDQATVARHKAEAPMIAW